MYSMKPAEGTEIPDSATELEVVNEWRDFHREDLLRRCHLAVDTAFYVAFRDDVKRVSEKIATRSKGMTADQRLAYAFGMGVINASCNSRMAEPLGELWQIGEAMGLEAVSLPLDRLLRILLFNSMSFVLAADSALDLPEDDLYKALPEPTVEA